MTVSGYTRDVMYRGGPMDGRLVWHRPTTKAVKVAVVTQWLDAVAPTISRVVENISDAMRDLRPYVDAQLADGGALHEFEAAFRRASLLGTVVDEPAETEDVDTRTRWSTETPRVDAFLADRPRRTVRLADPDGLRCGLREARERRRGLDALKAKFRVAPGVPELLPNRR